ncbi:eCIS core domain-containing protein [Cyclobacterium jeungdonense]|uniref:DUF4157 domain-containing protein n=1 Tax=Cyclobacterium jeungdonense TaxID=708087 RepID=A0ABT8CDC5_9BACT|nr:DUF4157 domain-containing protein [Cyclobacterium jeungdonense]MDN3689969.1 DUF4157 domain-containing protein [Cyclobacterium jeungdonense]
MKVFQRTSGKPNHAPAAEQSGDFFQAKLQVGQPGDKYEQEADAMADQVVQRSSESQLEEKTDSLQTQEKTANEVQKKAHPAVDIQPLPLAANVTPVFRSEADEEPAPEDEMLQKQEEEVYWDALPGEHAFPGEQGAGMVQRKEDADSEINTHLESQISQKSGGSAMDPTTRKGMESGFGADFSQVNVHTDAQAVQMSQDLGAQAFTHGRDIYFNEGKYNPSSQSGQHLLAHELTHTIQQGASSSVQPKMIQKEGDEELDPPEMQPETGVLDDGAKTITFDAIPVPGFKLLDHRGSLYTSKAPLKRKNNYTRGKTNQRDGVWKTEIDPTSIKNQLIDLYENHHHTLPTAETTHVFKAAISGRSVNPTYIGNIDTVSQELTTPVWGKNKAFRNFDVDHIVELQLANWNTETWPNTLPNMELLDSSKNSSSGSTIRGQITDKLTSFIERHGSEFPGGDGYFKNNYTLVFTQAESLDGGDNEITENEFWTKRQIETAEHLDAIEVGNLSDIGNEGEVRIFPNESGGLGKRFVWTGEESSVGSDERNWLGNPFRIVNKHFNTLGDGVENTPNLGSISVNIPSSDNIWDPWPEDKIFEVTRYPGSKYAGYVTKQSIKSSLYGLRIKKASPVEIIELELMPNGIEAYGHIMPNIPIFEGSPIEFFISNGEIRVSKTFPFDQINVPSPFEITGSSLTIFASSENGLGLTGQTDFAINQVGEGHISATASTTGGFALEGAFNFDSELFDPAEINVEYKENTWTIGGEIGIPEGKVRGVKSATITASYSENNFSASGEAELDIPGIERGSMDIQYGEAGFSIGGNFDLSSDIPGITGGNVEARVSKPAGAETYEVFVSGTAQPDIPGITTSLAVTYENGALTIEGSASYSRGMLSGTVEVGATNRPIGEDGQPAGEPDESMRVYGGGELTLQLTPWLAATAGVRLLPNGEIEVNARLASESYEVFRRREFNRNLFRVPTIEIPLFAIPLGPRSIGLVAQIGGGLDFTAGFGPGELRNLSAEITYNPEREEETTVAGHGEFAIPADAGLTLRGDLGLGVSIAIASLSGGIELTGTLGLEGEALAEVDVNWSPQTGLALDASGRITVNPKFIFEINAFARASLGIGFLSISETWRHNLAAYEWGPGIQFGIVFPVHYREGEPFDMSFDDIEVIYPDLDVVDMAKGLALDIKDDLFA